MACFWGNLKGNKNEKCVGELREKVRALQEEVRMVMSEREKEARAYGSQMVTFAFKEAEWKQERKKLKEEVRRLRKTVEEKEEKVRGTTKVDGTLVLVGGKSEELDGDWRRVLEGGGGGTEERAWRDEAVDKWKKLYLAIKTELDDLIKITHHGEHGLYLKAEEEEMMEELRMEVKAKEETIQELKARLAMVEREEYKRAREVDILRQSLRIMSSKKHQA